MGFPRDLLKKTFLLVFLLIGINVVVATPNVIDVDFKENAYEVVTYNPTFAGAGEYYDAGENQSEYAINGTIVVSNTHSTEAVENIVLNVSGIANIYNVVNSAGKLGYVTEFNTASDYMLLLIPDLGSGDNVTFSYQVNSTNVAPPLNFTTSYSDSRIFGGLPLGVTDTLSNNLDSALYTENCIYNINIVQNALYVNDSGGVISNFTFVPSTLAGSDAGNVLFNTDNRTLNWSTLSNNCLNSTNTTDISYDVNTPNVAVAADYKFINSTMNYTANFTFSRLTLSSVNAVLDLDLNFEKKINQTLNGDNATWEITSQVLNPTNITVNMTQVSLWVSVRDGTGTGFTNPAIRDNDTISGADLLRIYNSNTLLNNTLSPWNNSDSKWYFNYTFSSSPIVWMDLENHLVNDGVQILNRSISYGENQIYIKEIYLASGYWLQIFKNITRLSDNNYSVHIEVVNVGTSPTPKNQVVQIYNFLPNTFNLTSPFVYSTSTWYSTVEANETLNDPLYNGTMFQYGLIPGTNPYNSSLAAYGGSKNQNNSWTVTFNVTGSGEYDFDDLFLTGVDPLNVEEYGSTLAVIVEGSYDTLSAGLEYILGGVAVLLGALILFL